MAERVSIVMLLGLAVAVAPAALLCLLGLSSLFGPKLSERSISRFGQTAIVTGLAAAVGVLAMMLLLSTPHVSISLGDWVVIPGHYHFSFKLVFDRLSIPFAILSFVLCGTIGAFASRYMHREAGFNRFFVLYALFLLGMVVASLAGTIETLFVGWELVGLSSAFLVAFFQERPAPVRNGLHIWTVYRISDAALLTAALILHHMTGEGDFDKLMGANAWPLGQASLTSQQALVVGSLLLVAAAGKSAMVPFSGWLPRAMEGPTPSSAVFYGALSVHLGAFLLLRAGPVLERSPLLCVTIVIFGLATAAVGALAGRVQTDIKSALSFASLTQVGIIVAEIGMGLRYVALVHILGHACLRTLQFVRAPSLLHDYRSLENAIGARLPRLSDRLLNSIPATPRVWLYRFSLERGFLDTLLTVYIVTPVLRLFQWCDAQERRWTDFLAGQASRESDLVKPSTGGFDELL